MKLTTFLMIIGCIHVSAAGYSQKISLSERNVSLNSVFSKMEKQTGYLFFSNSEFIGALPNVSISIQNATLAEALDVLLRKFSLSYSIVGKNVVITPVSEKVNGVQKALPLLVIGAVLDEKGKPIPGANVKVKGTIQRTVTDQDGKFRILVTADDAVLQVSYVGFQPREIPVKGMKNPFVIELKAITSDLDQVQVIAYGTTTKRTGTGNVTTLTAEDIAKNPGRNVLEIAQGQIPGLFIQQTSGLPGSPFRVTIRGQQTLTNGFRGSPPLIIVDGVALPSGPLPLNQNGGRENLNEELKGGNPLDYIDPSTIESFTVLKDADATSIYGSRGAYGVILITTKKGKVGSPKLDLNVTSGITVMGITPKLLNTDQYIMLRTEAYQNDGTPITSEPTFDDINGPNAHRFTNFQKEFTSNHAVINRINANYSGGTADLSFLISGNYRKQTSIQIGKGSIRDGGINFNINSNSKNKKFSITFSGNFLSTTDDAVPFDFNQNPITNAPNSAPFFLPDGSLNWIDYSQNPASAINIIYKNVTNNLTSSLGLKYIAAKGLTFNANISYNYMNSKSIRALPTSYFQPGSSFITTSTLGLYSVRNLTIEPNVAYQTALGSKGELTVQAGGTLQNQLTYQTAITGNDFISDDLLINPTFADPLTTGANPTANVTSFYDQSPNKYLGFFGILNYNWDKKYILNINARRDGSTKFGENNQFGNFGSIGTAWIISSENWFKSLLPIISFAKLRGSIGTVGGDGIANYGYLTTYSKGTTYQGALSLQADNLSNKDLHWEHNRKAEGGLTLEFLNGKINLDASYYDSKTSDQLVAQGLASTTGFIARQINSPAVIRNYGWEFELTTKNIVRKGFSWTTHLNITLPKNILVAYPGLGTSIIDPYRVVGKPVQGIKVYDYAGVDPATGLYNFINRNGVKGTYRLLLDPVQLDANLDKTQFIDLTPKFYGGINNNFTYKNISMDVFFTFTNRMGKSFLGSQTAPAGFPGQNLSTALLDRWQKPGDITNIQRAGAGFSTLFSQSNFISSTGAYEKATYARLSNLNLSYSLSPRLAKKLGVNALSIFGQGSNLLTISKYGDLDPENLGSGTAPLRTFSGGLRVTL